MKHLSLTVFFLGFLLVNAKCQTTDSAKSNTSSWLYVTSNSDFSDKWYVRDKCVSRSAGGVKIWIKCVSKSMKIGSKIYKNAELFKLIEVECTGMRYKTYKMVWYNSNGKIIDSEDNLDMYGYTEIVVDSVIEAVCKAICFQYG